MSTDNITLTGKTVPDFEAQSTAGRFQLSERSLPKLVLYFYPKDSTPGCTNEGNDFRDLHAEFLAAGTDILGVSRDSLKSHGNFRTKQNYPFHLISDPEETLCLMFNVMKMKNMYGKQVRGIERSTFVIDSKGTLAREWRGLKVAGHAAEVLTFVQTLA